MNIFSQLYARCHLQTSVYISWLPPFCLFPLQDGVTPVWWSVSSSSTSNLWKNRNNTAKSELFETHSQGLFTSSHQLSFHPLFLHISPCDFTVETVCLYVLCACVGTVCPCVYCAVCRVGHIILKKWCNSMIVKCSRITWLHFWLRVQNVSIYKHLKLGNFFHEYDCL